MNTAMNTNQTDSITIENTTSNSLDRDAILASGSQFAAYDSQLPIAERKGCRIVKCLYKKNMKTGEIAGTNSYVYIPDSITDDSIAGYADRLLPYFISFLQEKEDSIVKELHKSGATTVYPTNVGIEKVLEMLESSVEGNRLNKEKIESWFDTEMLEPLAIAFADKLQTSVDAPKVLDILQVYRNKFASLASGKTMFRKEEAETLQKALGVCKQNTTAIGGRFYNRLESMKTKDSELLLAL